MTKQPPPKPPPLRKVQDLPITTKERLSITIVGLGILILALMIVFAPREKEIQYEESWHGKSDTLVTAYKFSTMVGIVRGIKYPSSWPPGSKLTFGLNGEIILATDKTPKYLIIGTILGDSGYVTTIGKVREPNE